MNNSGQKTLSGILWRFLERCGAQLVTFVVSIILARILDPAIYGTIALVTVFTTILNVFIDCGLSSSLIQKKEVSDLDYSTVFYMNMAMCLFLYGVLFFSAPLIARFYALEELTNVVRVLGLVLIISGVKNVQVAYVSRNMMFKKFFFATLGGTIGAAVLGIFMAVKGYGVWSLVAQHLFNTTVDTIILWLTVKWRPKWMFSWKCLKEHLKYGWKLLVSGLLDTVFNKLRELIIGKKYSTEDLAYYNKGNQFPSLIVTNINTSIDSALLPTMSKEQDDKIRIKAMTRRAIKTSVYIMAPLMIGLLVVSEPLVRLLLTEKWLPCVFFLRIYCITYMFFPIHTANLNAIKAMGRSDYFLKLEIIKKIMGLTLILSTMWISVEAMAYSLLLSTLLSMIINTYPNKKLLNYSFFEQMKDILPYILLAIFMGVPVFFISYIPIADILVILIQVVVGAVIYVAMSKIFKLEIYQYLKTMIKSFFKGRKKKKVVINVDAKEIIEEKQEILEEKD